jgi:peptide-methionine (S)-S-oxide reductase
MKTFYLAGGCFWCLDAAYRQLKGVSSVVSGYANGKLKHPTYEAVCTGLTGDAEAVAVTFDPEVIPAETILDIFFTIHDPRTLNRQGNDVGPQYRSGMYYTDEAERELFQQAATRATDTWDGRIVTEIVPLAQWVEAEDYHQDYYAKNPLNGYCFMVARPKVNKVRQGWAEYLR